MIPGKSAPRAAHTRSHDRVIIPSDFELDLNDIEEAITVIGPEPGPSRTAARRKAPNLPLPLPLPKRRGGIQVTHDVPRESASQKPPHDPRFWYPDGNVVIKVGDVHFKLLRSRLSAQQCHYFQDLFSPPKENQSQLSSSTGAVLVGPPGGAAPSKELDGCDVYEISMIDVSDFTTFVSFLEYPTGYSVSTAPSDKLYSLLRVSDTLGCDRVHDLARKAVAEKWSSLQPTKKEGYSDWSAGSYQRVYDAIQAIVHARKYRIHRVLKGAFYELLRNSAFWDAFGYTHARPSPGQGKPDGDILSLLPLEDVLRLHQVDRELRKEWAKLVRTPPGTRSDNGWELMTCEVCRPPDRDGQRQARADVWALETLHAGGSIEFRDPIAGTYRVEEWLDKLKRHSRGQWCEKCLEERKHAWSQARTVWWQKMDVWFQTVPGEQAVMRT